MPVKSILSLVAMATALTSVAPAFAQDASSVVLMRRSLDPKTRTFGWVTSDWSQCSNSCGSGQQTRSVQCMMNGSRGTPEVNCTADKPEDTQACYDIQGCSYTWQPGEWTDVSGCGQVVETRELTCLRGDGQTVSNDQCPQPAPNTSREVRDLRTCSYEWKTDQWSAFSSECQTDAVQTRNVWCERSNGEQVSDAECAGSGAKPAALRTENRYGACGYQWNEKPWSAWSSSCQTGAVRTRDVECVRSNGDVVADGMCAGDGPKPEISQQSDQYGSCSYEWNPGSWSQPVPACGQTIRTRQVDCVRSNGDIVDGSLCTAQTKPDTQEAATDFSTCTYSWSSGEWGAPSSSCGSATQTRSVTCQSSDGRTVDDRFCHDQKPETSQSSYQTSGCGYEWQAGSFGAPAAACGATTQTRSVSCRRSDGQTVADSFCPAGSKPSPTQGATDYSTCGYSWNAGSWGAWSTTCGQASQSRSVTCLRSDGTTVGDEYCGAAGTKPGTSQSAYQVSGCGYGWQTGGWNAPAAACGASSQTRSVWCQRSDGATVGDEFCGGGKPAASQGATDYSACGYSWAYNGWSTSSQTCGNITQTRSVWCQRSDGQTVADSYCGGGKPGASQSWADYSNCSYQVAGWSGWSYASSCSTNTTATQYATGCRRSDGAILDASECSNRGIATTQSTQTSNLSGCGYSWQTGGWSAQQNVCTTGTQYRDIWCQRSDGAHVDWSLCGGGQPASSQTYSNTNACGYTAYYGGWSTCANSQQSQSMTLCQRSDGASVAGEECVNRGQPWTRYQSCESRQWVWGWRCQGGDNIGYWDYGGRGIIEYETKTGVGFESKEACVAAGGNCYDMTRTGRDGEQGSDTIGETVTCWRNSTLRDPGWGNDGQQAWIYQ